MKRRSVDLGREIYYIISQTGKNMLETLLDACVHIYKGHIEQISKLYHTIKLPSGSTVRSQACKTRLVLFARFPHDTEI